MGGESLVKPMTPPANLSNAGKMGLPLTSPGVPDIGSAAYARNELQRLAEEKAHPWGTAENHPGVIGKIGHVLGRVGNIAADVLAPGIALNIPGSDLNKLAQENQLKRELATRTAAEGQAKNFASEEALRGVQTEEGRQRLLKQQTEENLQTDSQGFVTGYKDALGKLHSIDEPDTPQGIKDIAAATEAKTIKPSIEKMDNGDIVAVTPGRGGAAPTSQVVYHGDPKLETELTQRTVNGQEHKILVNKKTGDDIKDLGAFKTETSPTQALTKMKSDEELVLGYDKNNKSHLMSRADAAAEGLQHISKAEGGALEKASTHQTVLNTLQTQLNNVVDTSKALDQNLFQRGIIANALSHPTNSTADSLLRAAVLSGASEQTKDYVQAVLNLREAGMALPKEITGGSRVTEIQTSALWATMPSASSLDEKYAIKQAKKFQSDIDRLRQRAPLVRGIDYTEPHEKIAGTTKQENTAGGGTAQPPAGKTAVYNPQGEQHFVNSDKVDQFLKDPKYKGWTKNAPKGG